MKKRIVFISYSHDSDEHREKVLALSERLRSDGIETRLDQYVNGTPNEGWPRWMLDRLEEADSVLVICTETYYRRFRGHLELGKGKGVDWEGALITLEIYKKRSRTLKFVPVLFAAGQEAYIPEPLGGYTYYILDSELDYEALYDALLDQDGVEPGALRELRLKPRRKREPLTFGEPADGRPQRTTPTRLTHTAETLFGRTKELALLNDAWEDPKIHIVTLVAWGGIGKTSLVATWAAGLAARGYDGANYFDWSFYSQGTRGTGGASGDAFIAAALKFFGDAELAQSAASPWDKGARLAQLVAERRTLLVLDGLEPLQHPPGPLEGELKDPAITALLKGLAARNSGLCVVTSRATVVDLAPFETTTAPEWEFEQLSTTAGVHLLESLGVHGADAELSQLVEDVEGHALTLNLLGRFLFRVHKGDVRRRDRVDLAKADRTMQGGHAFRTIAAYETWLGGGGEEGVRQVAVLRLLGLFDRPAAAGCLAALRREPVLVGLTEALVGLGEEDWNLALSTLAKFGLVSLGEGGGGDDAVDAHPLIREYFAQRLREGHFEGWRSAHERLFEYLQESTEHQPEGLEGLQPLYQAVVHGCLAGRQEEAYEEVYRDRINRGTGNDGFYSTQKLGALGAELGAVACFFEQPWSRISPSLTEAAQAWLLSQTAFLLRALGRLTESIEPMRIGLQMGIEHEDWKQAAIRSSVVFHAVLTLSRAALARSTFSIIFSTVAVHV